MSTKVTLSLPDDTYRRAAYLADLSGRPVKDVLADTLNISLPPFDAQSPVGKRISEMSDADALALANSHMDLEEDRVFRDLLNKQQSGTILDTERSELTRLMQLYQAGLLRKAQALHEAARRGLIGPLAS
jgi:hypothetical protein